MVEFLLNSHNINSNDKSGRIVDIDNPEGVIAPEPKTRKSLALKILALKCVAHLKWKFQLLENK